VQTEVVHVDVSCARRTHSTAAGSSKNGTFPEPGMTMMSGVGTWSSEESAVDLCVGQASEHLVGADRIKGGHPVVEEQRDLSQGGPPLGVGDAAVQRCPAA
jgi:hypothetical protein